MTINTDLLLEIREQITSHPETHDQNNWGERTGCGTTHCIAGWAAVLTGAVLDWRADPDGYTQVYYANNIDPETYAGKALGLDPDEAHRLFYKSNADALFMLDKLIEEGKNAA